MDVSIAVVESDRGKLTEEAEVTIGNSREAEAKCPNRRGHFLVKYIG